MFTIPAIHPNGDGSSYIARQQKQQVQDRTVGQSYSQRSTGEDRKYSRGNDGDREGLTSLKGRASALVSPPPPTSWLRQCKKVADLSRYGVLRAEGGKIGPVGPGQLTARVAAGELLAARDARRVVVARCRGHQPGQDGPLGHLHI